MESRISIKKITALETYSVRQPVLRKGRSIDSCRFDGDDLSTTFHLGIFSDNKLAGIATFLENTNKLFTEKKQFQLRGMAILKEYQKKGLGELLLKEGEAIILKKNGDRLWFNARELAVSFYKKNGFNIFGSAFNIPEIGLHYKMTKTY